MGKRGPLPKPADEAQGHRTRELQIISGSSELKNEPPKPLRGCLGCTINIPGFKKLLRSHLLSVVQPVK